MKSMLPLLLMLLALGCKKDEKKEADYALKIEGFLLRDNYGQVMGTAGNADDDWKLGDWASLSAREQAFLGFPDTINLNNTTVTELRPVMAYPNPLANSSALQFWAGDSVKVKVALVDAKGTVHRTFATKFKTYSAVMFDVSDRTLFPTGTALRYYYSFSAAGNPHFKAGYGDVKVCVLPSGGNVMQCF